MMPFSYHLSNLLLIALETMQLLVRIDLTVKEKVHFQEIVLSLIFQDSVREVCGKFVLLVVVMWVHLMQLISTFSMLSSPKLAKFSQVL